MKKLLIPTLLCIGVLFNACQSSSSGNKASEEGQAHTHESGTHGHEDDHNHNHDHDHEDDHDHGHSGNISRTVWTDRTELFVEFPPLVMGQEAQILAHLTDLSNFKPIRSGQLTCALFKDGKGDPGTPATLITPGIFKSSITPKEVGMHQLLFNLRTNNGNYIDQIFVHQVEVFANQETVKIPESVENPNEITLLKEQTWKMHFANAPVRKDTIHEIIHCGGEIVPTTGTEKTVIATSNGILIYQMRNATLGKAINNGQLLFKVSGGGMLDLDLEARFKKAATDFEIATTRYERRKKLYEGGGYATASFEEDTQEYQKAKTEYEALDANYSKDGKPVYAPQSGYLKALYHSEGSFVESGTPLALIATDRTVTLRADVGQEYFNRLSQIHSANFSAQGKQFSLEELGGRLLSYGRTISKDQPQIPVYFQLPNSGDFLPGSFVEVFIQLQAKGEALTIPSSALLEKYGQYSVMVQTGGESFVEKPVLLGIDNGQQIEILSGLKKGERVVTQGAFQVKMAGMNGDVPDHGHAH